MGNMAALTQSLLERGNPVSKGARIADDQNLFLFESQPFVLEKFHLLENDKSSCDQKYGYGKLEDNENVPQQRTAAAAASPAPENGNGLEG